MTYAKKIFGFSLLFLTITAIIACDDDAPLNFGATTLNITAVSPDSGFAGDQVIISASGLAGQSDDVIVRFDGARADIVSAEQQQLIAEVPEEATSGAVSLEVAGETTIGPYFTVLSRGPVIRKINPGQGKPGTRVTIIGDHFLPTAANVNDIDSTAASTDKKMKNKSADSGQIFERSKNKKQSLANGNLLAKSSEKFKKKYADMGIDLPIEPPESARKNVSLGDVTISVTIGGELAPIISLSDNKIITEVPKSVRGSAITITVGNKSVTSTAFNIIMPPEISSFTPKKGAPGMEVTISGAHFSPNPDSNAVFFNGFRAEVIAATDSQLTTVVSAEATSGPIKVTARNQSAISSLTFSVTQAPMPPIAQVKISGVTPKSGPVGTTVTIKGQNFSSTESENTVMFNGAKANVQSATQSKIVAVVPQNATDGPVKVSVNNQTATGPNFNLTADPSAQLKIKSISPKQGPVGTSVTILGENFSATKANNIVTFNGTKATISSASKTKLVVSVPQGATTGPLNVQVGNQTAEGPTFTVTDAPVPQVSITDISPKEGVAGSTVTITGENFSADKTKNTVTFNGAKATVSSVSTTKLVVTVPSGATTGVVKVKVESQTATGPTFTVTEATISSASKTKLVVSVPQGATTGPVNVQVGSQTAEGPTFTVTENHAPAFTGTQTAFSVDENTASVVTLAATDPDGDALTYSISGGTDQGLFSIDTNSGALVFKDAPDYENPTDTGGDNGYELQVQASDGSLTDTQALTITVQDETGPITFIRGSIYLDSGPIYRADSPDFIFDAVPEGTDLAAVRRNIRIAATAVERNLRFEDLDLQVSGPDASFFNVYGPLNLIPGIPGIQKQLIDLKIEFTGATPDYENPVDAGADNTYKFKVTITDTRKGDSFTQLFTIPISDVNKAPTFTGNGTFAVQENLTTIGTVQATDPDNNALSYSISGGADAGIFTINATTGELAFYAAPDYDYYAYDNSYEVEVTASDGQLSTTKTLNVAVQNVATDPYYAVGQILVGANFICQLP